MLFNLKHEIMTHSGRWFTVNEDDKALLFHDNTESNFKILITVCNSKESKSLIRLEVDELLNDDDILSGECKTYLVCGNKIKVKQTTDNEIDNEEDKCEGTYTISLINKQLDE